MESSLPLQGPQSGEYLFTVFSSDSNAEAQTGNPKSIIVGILYSWGYLSQVPSPSPFALSLCRIRGLTHCSGTDHATQGSDRQQSRSEMAA